MNDKFTPRQHSAADAARAIPGPDPERRARMVETLASLGNAHRDVDLAQFRSALTDNFVFRRIGDTRRDPDARVHEGPDAMLEFLRRRHTTFANEGSELSDIMIDGDWVVLRRISTLRHRGTGQRRRMRICDWFRFDGDRIAEFIEFSDTAAISELIQP